MAEALDVAGCAHIAFNPVTVRNAAKALELVADAEGVELSCAHAMTLAEHAGGDLHHALGMLQLAACGRSRALPRPAAKKVSLCNFSIFHKWAKHS